MVQQNRLSWYGHTLRKDDGENAQLLRLSVSNNEEERKTWKEAVDKDMLDLELKPGDAMDRSTWKARKGVLVWQ